MALAIEAFVDLDCGFGIAAAAGTGEKLQAVGAEGDGVVVADDALVLEAKDRVRIEASRPRAIGGGVTLGRPCKARIEAGEEVCEVGVRAVAIAHAREAKFAAESTLEGTKEPLDAALGLRTVRGDPVDAQFLEGAFDLCGRGLPRELLGEGQRLLRRAVEDAVAIAVGGDGDALGLSEGVKDLEVAVRIFLVPKRGGGDVPRGVINDRQEGEAGAALLEPLVVAPVELHEQTLLGHPLPPTAVTGRAALPGAADPRGAEEAGDRLGRQPQCFALSEELSSGAGS